MLPVTILWMNVFTVHIENTVNQRFSESGVLNAPRQISSSVTYPTIQSISTLQADFQF